MRFVILSSKLFFSPSGHYLLLPHGKKRARKREGERKRKEKMIIKDHSQPVLQPALLYFPSALIGDY